MEQAKPQTEVLENFRVNLNQLLERKGRGSQYQLSLYLGCRAAFVSQLSIGAKHPSVERLAQIAEFFRVSPATLLKAPRK